jgi:transposase
VAEKRAHWHERLVWEGPARLVFVDESGANTKMTRYYGRCPGDQRLIAAVPPGHYETSTLIAAIRLRGPWAPWLFEGAMNGEMFLAWVRQGLAPTLRKNDLVIMDNLATHKVAGVCHAIETSGARLLYLPPYSPDFNPLENMWSKIKQILRRAAPRTQDHLMMAARTAFNVNRPDTGTAGTLDHLMMAARTAFNAISVADCRSLFLHAQYATSLMEML